MDEGSTALGLSSLSFDELDAVESVVLVAFGKSPAAAAATAAAATTNEAASEDVDDAAESGSANLRTTSS